MALTDFLRKLGLLKGEETTEAPAGPQTQMGGSAPESTTQPEETPQEMPQ